MKNSTQQKIRFAIVGFGHIGKKHATMILNNPECELVSVCDCNPVEKSVWADSDIPFFASLDQMLSDIIDFDILCVATPNGLHEEHAIKGLRANHHVIIEKPMALTSGSCENIIAEAVKMQKQVFCVMQNRYSPPAVWLKEVIGNKILGEIFIVEINCYWNRDDRYYIKGNWHGSKSLDGGTLFTQFSHYVDMMYWLFGDIKNIKSRFENFNHKHLIEFEDSGFVQFDFVGQGVGILNYSTSVWNKNLESSLTVIAENGTIKLGGQYMDEVYQCDVNGYHLPELSKTNQANEYGVYKGSAANHHYVFENAVDVLKERDVITTNASDGLKVVDIIEKIYKASFN